MYNKFLVLKFNNAKLFTKTKDSKDKSFDLLKGQKDRNAIETFDEPLTVFQISNVLHVLFGERPVSSVRLSLYGKNNYLFEKAKESYLKIENPRILNKRTEQLNFITEAVQIKKGVWNSWKKTQVITWERIKTLLGDKQFTEFIALVSDVYKINCDTHTANELIALFRNFENGTKDINYGGKNDIKVPSNLDDRFIILFQSWFTNNCSSLIVTFFDKNSAHLNSVPNRTALTTVMALDKTVACLKGTILVPVNNEDIKKIYRNCCTILDGGFLYIDDIVDIDMYGEDEEFVNVNEINLTKSIK